MGWIAAQLSLPPEDLGPTGTDPAYIMFTSGSTGEPKGAVIPHQGVLSLMEWARAKLGAGPPERFTNINPLHFDNSVFDIYCGLLNGAALAPIETGEITNPAAWVKAVRQAEATVLFAVPTFFLVLDQLGLLTPAALPTVRTFIFGGEGYPIGKLRDFYRSICRQGAPCQRLRADGNELHLLEHRASRRTSSRTRQGISAARPHARQFLSSHSRRA